MSAVRIPARPSLTLQGTIIDRDGNRQRTVINEDQAIEAMRAALRSAVIVRGMTRSECVQFTTEHRSEVGRLAEQFFAARAIFELGLEAVDEAGKRLLEVVGPGAPAPSDRKAN